MFVVEIRRGLRKTMPTESSVEGKTQRECYAGMALKVEAHLMPKVISFDEDVRVLFCHLGAHPATLLCLRQSPNRLYNTHQCMSDYDIALPLFSV